MSTENFYSGYYRHQAAVFDKIRLDRDAEIRLLVEFVAKKAHPHEGRVLEVGAGTGRYAAQLRRHGYEVVALDKSMDQLLYASRLPSLVRACATGLPFREAQFRMCLFVLMLQQLTHSERTIALAEAQRVLQRGGLVLIKTRSHADLKKAPFNSVFPSVLRNNLRRYPDIGTLESELRSNGFRIFEIYSTYSRQVISKDDLLYSIEHKHNTSLALLEDDELNRGRIHLSRFLSQTNLVSIPHRHTLIVAQEES